MHFQGKRGEDGSPERTILVLGDDLERFAGLWDSRPFHKELVGDMAGLLGRLEAGSCHGLVLDLRKTMRAGDANKQRLQAFVDRIPHLRVNVAPGGELRIMGDPEEFLDQVECSGPCAIRCARRIRRHAPLLYLPCGSRGSEPLPWKRSHSLDISLHGMHVYSTEPLDRREYLWIALPVLDPAMVILSRVCWRRDWGRDFRLSGMGVEHVWMKEDMAAIYAEGFCLSGSLDPKHMEQLLAEARGAGVETDAPAFEAAG